VKTLVSSILALSFLAGAAIAAESPRDAKKFYEQTDREKGGQ
jgi:hypothetical protein